MRKNSSGNSPKKKTQKTNSPRNANKSSRAQQGPQRLQRILASAGFGSRRECEKLIEEGRCEVDGEIVTKLGTKVDPTKQKMRVDGIKVKFSRPQYYAVNKPPGVISTSSDPSGRMRVIDLIDTNQRVYNVGRLDKSSEGLILVTNDGELANRLTHPRYGVKKIYMVQVVGRPEGSELKKLERGVYLAEGFAKVVGARIKKRTKDSTWLEITLDEGRNREIRRLLARIGHKVLRLRRVAIGPLRLGELPLGAHRRLERKEIEALWQAGDSGKSPQRFRKKSKKKSEPKSSSSLSSKTNPRKSKSTADKIAKPKSPKRKRKPRPGEEGWTIKSGGKRKKKKVSKRALKKAKAAKTTGKPKSSKPKRKNARRK